MRTNSMSRGCGLVLAVVAVVVSWPAPSWAQQTGLFPNMNIRRQRPPCDQEDPIYKIYKHQYFGYHPTCWRPFPDGWGCPSREAPDREKSFKEIPLQAGDRLEALGQPGMDDQPAQPGATRPGMPALPGGARSPFEDEPDQGRPAAPPAGPRGGQNPRQLPQADPFELDNKPAAPATDQPKPPAAGSASNGPDLSGPAEAAPAARTARTSRNQPAAETDGRDDDGPLLALPSVNLRPIDDPGVPFGTQPPPPAADTSTNGTSTAANPTPRRGFLSGLLTNLGVNWTRR